MTTIGSGFTYYEQDISGTQTVLIGSNGARTSSTGDTAIGTVVNNGGLQIASAGGDCQLYRYR